MIRTHDCGEIRTKDLGKQVKLAGWVRFYRDHGGVLFFDLADAHGTTQTVFDAEAYTSTVDVANLGNTLNAIGREYVISITGTVRERVPGTEDARNPTGKVEVLIEEAVVLSSSKPLPFEIAEQKNSTLPNEDVRMKYRYIDLRRKEMVANLRFRHKVISSARKYLDSVGFIEVETPMLTRSTQEGARDFLVPSRTMPGEFYALPQSPQLYKQMLMVGSVERYYQLARCFRDEDSRADRQPEFTQLDVEMSFVEQEDIFATIEGMYSYVWKQVFGTELPIPFPRVPVEEAFSKYGTDAPDVRFGLEIVNVTEEVKCATYDIFQKILGKKGIIVCINLRSSLVKEKTLDANVGRKQVDRLIEWAKQQGMGGLTWMRMTEEGLQSNIVKYFPDDVRRSLEEKMEADKRRPPAVHGRTEDGDAQGGRAAQGQTGQGERPARGQGTPVCLGRRLPHVPGRPGDRKAGAFHHPFVRPVNGDIEEDEDPMKIMGLSYDLVPERQRDRLRFDEEPRRLRAAQGAAPAGQGRGADEEGVRLLPRGTVLRRPAPWRDRHGHGPALRHAARLREHPRRDRVPQEQEVPIVGGRFPDAGRAVEAG